MLLYALFRTVYTVRGPKPDKRLQLTETEVRDLCLKSREVFLSQPMLLDLEAPLKICGELLCALLSVSLRVTARSHSSRITSGHRGHTRTVLGPFEVV